MLNHSKRNNGDWHNLKTGVQAVLTNRDIKPGEEIVINYGKRDQYLNHNLGSRLLLKQLAARPSNSQINHTLLKFLTIMWQKHRGSHNG